MSSHTGIAVLEGKWWPKYNTSVRETFDTIAEMICDDAHGYHYEMANSIPALDEAIPRIARDRKCRYLYIATHGNENALGLYNGEQIGIGHINHLLINLPSGSKFVGIYLGACSAANPRVATKLFEGDTKLTWMAGYSKDVEWLPSTALDMLFFRELLTTLSEDGESNAIKATANRLRLLAPGLVEELGFGIYMKSRGSVINLLVDLF